MAGILDRFPGPKSSTSSGVSNRTSVRHLSLCKNLTGFSCFIPNFFSSKLFLSWVFHFIPPFSSPCPAVCCGYICLVWSRPWWPTLEVLAPLIPAMCAKNSWCHWTRYSPGSPYPFHGRILWSRETVNMRWVHSRNRRREEKSSWEEGAVWRHLDASLLFYNPVIKYSRKKKLKEEFIWLTAPGYSPSLWKVMLRELEAPSHVHSQE